MNNSELSSTKIVLGSLLIMILATFIILPPVFRLFFSEQENEGPIEELDVKKQNIICNKDTLYDYGTFNQSYNIFLEGDNVVLVAYTKTVNYNDTIEISAEPYEMIKTNLTNINGVFYGYEITDNLVLENYRVTINEINLPYTLEDINVVNDKNGLVSQLSTNEFICK